MKTLEKQLEESPQENQNIPERKTTGKIFLKVLDLVFVPTSLIRHYIKAKKNEQPPREDNSTYNLLAMCDPFGSLRLFKKATIWGLITYFEMTRAAFYFGTIVNAFSNSPQ